jgi:hypothetical protein
VVEMVEKVDLKFEEEKLEVADRMDHLNVNIGL